MLISKSGKTAFQERVLMPIKKNLDSARTQRADRWLTQSGKNSGQIHVAPVAVDGAEAYEIRCVPTVNGAPWNAGHTARHQDTSRRDHRRTRAGNDLYPPGPFLHQCGR